MKKLYLGTTYGGWEIDIDSIKDGDTIIDAGLGEDISFLEELIKLKNINIIGIDPTIKSHIYVENKNIDNLTLIKKAIAPYGVKNIKIFKNSNPNHVSESYHSDHHSVNNDFYEVDTISFKELIEKYNPSFIKMDIEGAEYDVLLECIGVNQVCVEFHHHCMSTKTINDTNNIINAFIENGYKLISNINNMEYTFVKRELV